MEKATVLLGVSAAIKGVLADISLAAGSDAKVLITGESGVGKEVVARLIHQRSNRMASPLVTINCAGFPDTLLESELFGHVRGSFTDAIRDKRGWLEQAHRGTIFMDEIGEMSLRMQAMMLRFLETGEIQRVGSDRPLPPLDVRVIAATHRRLVELVAGGGFREDLYYRLNVIHIEVPPLRDRRQDITVLLNHFLTTFSSEHRQTVPEVSADALRRLLAYDWPGNVRELRNVAERLVLRCGSGRADVDALPGEITGDRRDPPSRGGQGTSPPQSTHRRLYDRIVTDRSSFWSEVYEPFMSRDLTREDVRRLIALGLERTRGNYRMLVDMFNMPSQDYKKFLAFLRKHRCHVPFQAFRTMVTMPGDEMAASCV
jgi:DNA-binding NtrC family response regulator